MPFEAVAQDEYILVKLTGDCKGDESPSLSEEFSKNFGANPKKRAVIQCSECNSISTSFLREMVQVYKLVESKSGVLRLVGANTAIQDLIKANGLGRILVNRVNLRGALVDFGLVKAQDFDVNFVNPFLNATRKILRTHCGLEAKPQRPYLKKPNDPLLLGDMSGIISVTAETFKGTMALSLPETIFLKIASYVWEEECSEVAEDCIELVRDVTNMILSQAKLELGSHGYTIQTASATCVWGREHRIKHFGGGVCVVLPFETEHGAFYSEIMTNNNLLNQVSRNPIKRLFKRRETRLIQRLVS